MREHFNDDGQIVIKPDCKDCKYAINDGIDGCKIDKQTMKIKVGIKSCKDFAEKEE